MGIKRMSKRSRQELVSVTQQRYRKATKKEKTEILNQIETSTGHNRKYLMMLLKDGAPVRKERKGNRRPSYDGEVLESLKSLWRLTNYVCAKRLVPFLPILIASLERHKSMSFEPTIKAKLLKISAATADRLLKPEREKLRRSPSLTKQGNLLRKHIQIRTFADWQEDCPGFVEVDTVAHHGGVIQGPFLNTLSLTDVATGWTEGIPLRNKTGKEALRGLKLLRKRLPFPLQGLDCDNGGEFMNEELIDYCDRQRLTLTRSREYRSNDQCHIEQKNGSVIRKLTGHARYSGDEAFSILDELYMVASEYVNFFQPSLKLKSKIRVGSKSHRTYEIAQTPYQRLLCRDLSNGARLALQKQFERIDPVELFEKLTALQSKLFDLSNGKAPQREPSELRPQQEDGESTVALTMTIYQESARDEIIAKIVEKEIGEMWSPRDLEGLSTELPAVKRTLRLCLDLGFIVKLTKGRYVRIANAPEFKQLSGDPKHKSIAVAMRNHFLGTSGEVVHFRELIRYGAGSSVRCVLSRLVAAGFIERLKHNQYRRLTDSSNIRPYKTGRKANLDQGSKIKS